MVAPYKTVMKDHATVTIYVQTRKPVTLEETESNQGKYCTEGSVQVCILSITVLGRKHHSTERLYGLEILY